MKWSLSPLSTFGLFVAAISLGFAAVLFDRASQLDASYQHQAQEKGNAYAKQAPERIEHYCAGLSLPDKRQCAREIIDAAKQAQHDERDLQAQRVTANWTRHMGIAAVFGTAFGIIGVALVLATFRAASVANDIADRTAKQQLRAYMGIRKYRITPMDHEQETDSQTAVGGVSITMQNFGQSPAIALTTIISIGFRAWNGACEIPEEWAFEGKELQVDVPPAAPMSRAVTMPKEIFEHYWDIPMGTVAVYVRLKASYLDIFNRRHEQTTVFYSRGKPYSDCEMAIGEQSRETTTQEKDEA